jgi:hypothetical protein
MLTAGYSEQAEKIKQAISSIYWGLFIFDEVQVAPA